MPSVNETVWFLTENTNKYREARSILSHYRIRIEQLKQPKIEIQDSSLENIARYALENALNQHNRLTLVEDSGLFIESLGGFPGPFSSYVHRTVGLNGVLNLLKGSRKRAAYFQSSIAVGSSALSPTIFTGRVRGKISPEIRGTSGFGYDPIFIPENSDRTFGQANQEFKNANSHRAKAFIKFARWYNSHPAGITGRKRVLK